MSAALVVAAGRMNGAVHPEIMMASMRRHHSEDRPLPRPKRFRLARWVVNQTIRNCIHRQ